MGASKHWYGILKRTCQSFFYVLLLWLFQYEVVLQYRSDSLYYVTNTICVRHKGSKTERLVWHLQYTAWPDHGCPEDIFGFLGMYMEIYFTSKTL